MHLLFPKTSMTLTNGPEVLAGAGGVPVLEYYVCLFASSTFLRAEFFVYICICSLQLVPAVTRFLRGRPSVFVRMIMHQARAPQLRRLPGRTLL
jgi:hypothetical protein